MSIALNITSVGSISTYAELVTEIRDLMDDDAYSQSSIDRALRKAEAQFNRTLRTPEMETRTILTISDELTPLPADFLEMRLIFSEATPDAPLKNMSQNGLVGLYRGMAGTPEAYSIEGRMIRVAPVGNAVFDMTYYRSIDPLSEALVSNWLLTRYPDLYVAGVMYYLARRERDEEGAAQAAQEVTALTDAINKATMKNRWGASPLTPAGIAQVSGARA